LEVAGLTQVQLHGTVLRRCMLAGLELTPAAILQQQALADAWTTGCSLCLLSVVPCFPPCACCSPAHLRRSVSCRKPCHAGSPRRRSHWPIAWGTQTGVGVFVINCSPQKHQSHSRPRVAPPSARGRLTPALLHYPTPAACSLGCRPPPAPALQRRAVICQQATGRRQQ